MKTAWPTLSYPAAKKTYETLHLWTQIVGKIKLSKLPWINHSWHVTLLVTPSGLTTSSLGDTNKHFEIDFDFVQHQLLVKASTGQARGFPLFEMPVADFYHKLAGILEELEIQIDINLMPNEVENAIPFNLDHTHATYNPEQAADLHQALLQAQEVFTQFRSEFRGKCSPVHFFWGSFDLAVSRFSGRTAPKHPGGIPNLPDWVVQEAYSHEVCSCGFWPGSEALPFAAFYSYCYPAPAEYEKSSIRPAEAYFHKELGEFILPYEVVKKAEKPSEVLLDFLRSTYEAGAMLAAWDREALEVKK